MQDLLEAQRWAKELRKGSTRLLLLTVLAGGETYGYQLLQTFRGLPSAHGATEATLYPLLHELEARGHLTSRWVHEGNNSGPPRKYYRLSRSGHRLLDALRQEWTTFQNEMDSVISHG